MENVAGRDYSNVMSGLLLAKCEIGEQTTLSIEDLLLADSRPSELSVLALVLDAHKRLIAVAK